MNTNTSDIVDDISKNNTTGLTKAQLTEVTNLVLASIGNNLKAGNEVRLHNFGAFSITKREARQGRNPATGESMMLSASTSVKFKASKALKDKVS